MIAIKPLKKSAGVALVTVLLIVAAATIAAVSISSRLQVDIRRTENLLRSDQAWLYMLAVESWAKFELMTDAKNSTAGGGVAVDHLDEDWAKPLADSSFVEGGTAEGEIIDQQGLLNINNLLKEDPNASQGGLQAVLLVPDQISIDRFDHLLTNLNPELDERQVDELMDALLDWLDEDDAPRNNGAEDGHYLALESPYSTANRLMVHPSELLLVKGFSKEIYEKISKFVTALPEHVALNLNAAEPEVMQSLGEGFREGDARSIARAVDGQAEQTNFNDLGEFMDEIANYNMKVMPKRDYLGVESNYFRVRSRVTVGKARIAVTSLLHRDAAGEVVVLQRMREDIY